MIKYKYNITFERVDIIGKHYGKYYTIIEASNFDSVVKKFKEQYENCEIIEIIRFYENKMEIKTKFNYGDTIFVVKEEEKRDLYGRIKTNWYVVETKVDFINIGYNGKDLGIRYTYRLYWEKDCFAIKEEAQKECDKRNGKD